MLDTGNTVRSDFSVRQASAVSAATGSPAANDAARARAEWGDWSGSAAPPAGAAQVLATASSSNRAEIGQARTHALLASDVYNDTAAPPAGYRVASGQDLARLNLTPAMLEQPGSSFRARVYVTGSGADTSYVVAFRGTQGRQDWINNAQQGVGWPAGHYAKAERIGQYIADSGVANVTLTGHSLGGGLASAAAIVSGREADTFNAAGLSGSTIDRATAAARANGVAAPGHVDAYHVRGEVLSGLQDGGDRIIGGILGGIVGGALLDLPEAYGDRQRLDAVKPEGSRFWENNSPVAKHGMDWVIRGLDRAAAQ